MNYLFCALIVYAFLHPIFGNTAQINETDIEEPCLVTTKLGKILGKVELSLSGKKYCSFLGIPYTNTPKRFEEAELGLPWTGVLNAKHYGHSCPQYEAYTENYIGDENCLFLNVHYPLEDQCQRPLTKELIPVLVHIHGGAFEFGSGADFGPKYIMNECTVFLSMNYRLSALGFLSTNDGLIPGNLGLKDQVVALQWTKENIDSFGGDPNSVTLIGLSAGSCAISHLIASPAANGLFHRAIAQSGSALQQITISKNPTRNALALASNLNCTGDDIPVMTTAALKECLLAASVKDIVGNQRLYKWNIDPFVSFAPSVEPINATNPIHLIHPFYKLASGDFNRVPLIMGFTENEGLLIQALTTSAEAMNDLNDKWEEIAPISLYYDEDSIPSNIKTDISNKIRTYYFGNKKVGNETFQNLTNLHSDRYFVQAIMDNVELHSRYAPVYPYVFAYKEGANFLTSFGYPEKAATHGSDNQFVFTYAVYPELVPGTPEANFSQKLIKLWLAFAKTGNPSETWPTRNLMKPYKNNEVEPNNWYRIDEEMSVLQNYLHERRAFWKNLGLRNYDYPIDY